MPNKNTKFPENQTSAGAVIYFVDSKGKIKFLLLKYKTYWGFAKGLIEKGESEEQAAEREVKEETNLAVSFISGFKHEQSWFFKLEGKTIRKKAHFFLAEVSERDSKEAKKSWEHDALEWLDYKDALSKMKIKANREMLRAAKDFIDKHSTGEKDRQKRLF